MAGLESLTQKQRAFALEYTKERNGVVAARSAGYRGDDQTLRAIAHENLTKPHIHRAIEELEAPALEKAQVTTERVIEQLADIAFAPWRKLEAPPEALVPLPAKLTALKALGEHLGMFDRRPEQEQRDFALIEGVKNARRVVDALVRAAERGASRRDKETAGGTTSL